MSIHWWGIVAGFCLLYSGTMKIITGMDGEYWGVPVPAWTGWIFLPLGVTIFSLSFRALRRGEGKNNPKAYTAEEAARAEAALDAMYLREHGAPPEKPKKGE